MTAFNKNIMSKLLIALLSFVFFSFSAFAELNLTEEEEKWVKDNPTVKFTGHPNWLPYEAFQKDGTYVGIVSEHLKLIEKISGLKFETIPVSSWTESLNIATEGEVSVISGDAADVILNKRFKPIDAYSESPIVIIMSSHQNYIEDLNELKNKKISIIKDYGYTADIFKHYPGIDFIEVENIQEGLEGVANGRFDAMLATIALATYTVSDLGVNNVKVIGKTNVIMELTLFIDKSKPILHSIINKSLKSISLSDSNAISQRWIKQHYIEKIDYELIVKISLAFFIMLLAFYFWNRRLSREIDLRVKTEIENKKIERELRTQSQIIDQIHDSVIATDLNGIIIRWNKGSDILFGYQCSDVVGEHVSIIYPESEHDRLENKIIPTLVLEGAHDVETLLLHKTGDVFYGHTSLSMIYDDVGEAVGMIGYTIDINERKITEQKLKESQILQDVAIKIAKLGYWKMNAVTKEVTGSNELFYLFEGDPKTSSFESLMTIIEPDYREKVYSLIERAVKFGEDYEVEYTIRWKDGSVKWIHALCQVIKDTENNVTELLGTVQDITKEKLIDIEFEESSRLFKAMFESIPDAIVYADSERKISMINGAAIDMFGYEEAELLGNQTVILYASPDDFVKQGVKRFNPEVVKQLTPNVIRYKTKLGDEFPGETLGTAVKTLKGDVLGYIGIIRDVSEREHVDAILRSLASGNANLDFSRFMDDVLTRITKLYSCKYAFIGRLQENNKSIKTLSVMASGNVVDNFEYELEGTPCQDILNITAEIIPKDVRLLYPSDTMLVDLGIESYFGAPLIASDGSLLGLLSVMDNKEMQLDEWTEPVLGVFAKRVALEVERDIADQKLKYHQEQLEEQVKIRTLDLVAARNEAERANEAKSEFLSSMSHELRTPMNAILGFAQMLELDTSKLSDIHNSNVKEILDAGNHLLDLINQVLNLAQIESGKLETQKEKVSLTKVIGEVKKLMAATINNKNITFVDNISEHDYFVIADFMKLKQILINIISNAIKYNHDSGKVTINSQLKDNRRIRISISDTGVGLSEDEVSRVFHPFERFNISENIEGTGIGLTITKHLCEIMGGELGVNSTLGEGSTFWIELKLAIHDKKELNDE